jgi:hypothetical protein
MLIARAVLQDGQDLLIIGLSAENRCLMEEFDTPIELRTHIGEGAARILRLLIFAGTTEDAMADQMQRLITHAEHTIAPQAGGH